MRNDFEEMDKMQDVLREAQTGLWMIELDAGKEPRMFADSAMLWLLGFTEKPSPEACYRGWYDRIVDAYYPAVREAVEKIVQDVRTEVEYPWIHPKWGLIHVRCGGVRDWSYKNGICPVSYTHLECSLHPIQLF